MTKNIKLCLSSEKAGESFTNKFFSLLKFLDFQFQNKVSYVNAREHNSVSKINSNFPPGF